MWSVRNLKDQKLELNTSLKFFCSVKKMLALLFSTIYFIVKVTSDLQGFKLLPLNAQVYHEGIVRLSENCARTAAHCNVQMYVELSSGQMLSSDKVRMCVWQPFLLRMFSSLSLVFMSYILLQEHMLKICIIFKIIISYPHDLVMFLHGQSFHFTVHFMVSVPVPDTGGTCCTLACAKCFYHSQTNILIKFPTLLKANFTV